VIAGELAARRGRGCWRRRARVPTLRCARPRSASRPTSTCCPSATSPRPSARPTEAARRAQRRARTESIDVALAARGACGCATWQSSSTARPELVHHADRADAVAQDAARYSSAAPLRVAVEAVDGDALCAARGPRDARARARGARVQARAGRSADRARGGERDHERADRDAVAVEAADSSASRQSAAARRSRGSRR